MCAKKYDNESIRALKGAARVRKRPAVIFGSDGIDGCEHSMFEILSNSIDEAREGFGDTIIITRFLDNSIEVEDFGRGIPVDYNEHEKKYNWELVFCELYAGGKYKNNTGGDYEYSLGWAPVLPNTAPNIWMWRFSETDINMSFILKPEKISTE